MHGITNIMKEELLRFGHTKRDLSQRLGFAVFATSVEEWENKTSAGNIAPTLCMLPITIDSN